MGEWIPVDYRRPKKPVPQSTKNHEVGACKNCKPEIHHFSRESPTPCEIEKPGVCRGFINTNPKNERSCAFPRFSSKPHEVQTAIEGRNLPPLFLGHLYANGMFWQLAQA